MKIGVDMHHGFLQEELTVEKALEKAKTEGFNGVYYKTPMYISETLDKGALNAASQCAKDLGLYIDFGIGRVNPYNTNETPEVWLLGGGDYRLALEKMIRAGVSMGTKEFIGVTAGWKGQYSGYHVYDRFRTDVTWDEQLKATSRFLKLLVPVLRETGARINLETHEEITSFEIIRLIEEVGDDVLGVAFDTANVVARAEEPVTVAKRTAPYIHQMHVKDCILYFSDTGLVRQVKPAGQGIVNFEEIFKEISKYNPGLHLQLEDHKGLMYIDIYEEEWRKLHPDIQISEVTELVRLAKICDELIRHGDIEDPVVYEKPLYKEQRDERLKLGSEYLKSLLRKLGLNE